jgi:hypothetical protein
MLAQALFYGGAGISVFPVNGRKEPLTGKGGFHHATAGREQIEAWWTKWPHAGIATPDFDVVDVDHYKPECKPTWQLVKPLIPIGTPHNRTPRGGFQYFFAPRTLKEGRIGPGIDNRYAGRNYVLLPRSMFDGYGRYEAVVDIVAHKPRPAPDFPCANGNGDGAAVEIARQISAGTTIVNERNTTTFWYAVGLVEANPDATAEQVRARVQAWVDSRVGGDLREVDVAKQVRGAFKWVTEHGNGRRVATRPTPPDRVRSLAEFKLEEAEFVERPLLQLAFTLLAGRPGVGKGALAALWVARCTNGAMYGTPRNALWLSSEDDPGIDLGPRVEVAGGDRERVFLIPHSFRLPDDVDWLRETARALGELGLVIIDPLGNHTGDANTDRESDVRYALMPLAVLANELRVPIIGVRHITTKESSGGALRKVLGSTAWIGVPRVVLAAAQDTTDKAILHLHPIKGNRVPPGESGRSFRLEGRLLPGFKETVVCAVAQGESSADIDALLAGTKTTSASSQARDLILETLRQADGEMESDLLDATVAAAAGVTAKTVQNLRGELRAQGLLRAFVAERNTDGTARVWHVALTHAVELHPLARGGRGSRDVVVVEPKQHHNITTSRVRAREESSQGTGQPHTFSNPPAEDATRVGCSSCGRSSLLRAVDDHGRCRTCASAEASG